MPKPNRRNNEWGTREDHREWTRLAFDYYKQLATLAGVGAAVVLAIYEQHILKEDLVLNALELFAIATIASITGMMRILIWVPHLPLKGDKPSMPLLAQLATYLLSGAVGTLVFAAVEFPRWLAYAVIAAYGVFLLYIFFGNKLLVASTPWLRAHVAPRLPKLVQRWLRRRNRR